MDNIYNNIYYMAQQNTNFGQGTLSSIVSGNYNVAFGYQAGNTLTTGVYNTAIGANAFSSGTTYSFSTAVGYNAQITGNNQIVMGTASESVIINGIVSSSSSTTGALQVGGGVGIRGNLNVSGGASFGGNLNVSGGASFGGNITAGNLIGYALYVSSDYRLKENVQPLTINRTVDVLKPVEYDHITGHQMGFIAHEVQADYPFLVTGEKDGGDYQTVNYNGLIALLVKEIQDIKGRLDAAGI